MTYTTVIRSGNVAEGNLESNSLLRFAYNQAGKNLLEGIAGTFDGPNIPFSGIVNLMQATTTPLVFLYYLTTGPFLYKKRI
ncbi:hypothetical protein J4430_01560 [Candidatus Woesearchaeota archaeon]|nr:hypothetical protein [Candidatus Woesearchaeota archaeon]